MFISYQQLHQVNCENPQAASDYSAYSYPSFTGSDHAYSDSSFTGSDNVFSAPLHISLNRREHTVTLQHISIEHVSCLNYFKCRIQLNINKCAHTGESIPYFRPNTAMLLWKIEYYNCSTFSKEVAQQVFYLFCEISWTKTWFKAFTLWVKCKFYNTFHMNMYAG